LLAAAAQREGYAHRGRGGVSRLLFVHDPDGVRVELQLKTTAT